MGYGDQTSVFSFGYGFILDIDEVPLELQIRLSGGNYDIFFTIMENMDNFFEQRFPGTKIGIRGHLKDYEGTPGDETLYFIFLDNDTTLTGEDLGNYRIINVQKLMNPPKEDIEVIDYIANQMGKTNKWITFAGNF